MALPQHIFANTLRWLTLYSLIVFLAAAPTLAQDGSTGAIRGSISDPGGARIVSAEVVLVNTSTGVRRTAATNSEGTFTFELLPPGDYSLRVLAPRMSPHIQTGLHLELGAALQLDLRLSIATAQETITVSEPPSLVETQASSVSSVIDERAISDLPLNGRRFSDLALLTPGVTEDPRGLTSSSTGDLAFGGIRGYQSSYLVDGADNNNAFFAQARGRYRAPYQFSNEVVKEYRVSSNTYGAELGRAGGAVVNVVTKSGTNHLHGTAFYYLRDSRFNARPPFMDFKPRDQQHQFGFTLGGPLRRNHAFFYAGFDQHIFHEPTVVRFDTGASTLVPQAGNYPVVPPDYEADDRALVFSAADRLSTLAGNFRSTMQGNAGFFKVDLALTPRHYLNARVSTSRYYGDNNVFLDPASPLTTYSITDNGEEQVRTETGTLSLTSAFMPHLTSHLRLQFSRDLQESSSNSSMVQTRIYGIIDGFGRSSILPRTTREHKFHVADTLSSDRGRHGLKLGGDLALSKIYNFFPSLFGGEYIFDDIRVNPFTFEPWVYGTHLTPLRAFAHAVPRYYIQNFGQPASRPDTNEYAAFAQDAIRLTSRLALNLGIRYDLQTFATKGLRPNPLWPQAGKVPVNTGNVAPRVGLALSLGNQQPFIIRGGYGLFYTRIPSIYTSAVATDNGITNYHLYLDNRNFYDRPFFAAYPNPIGDCPISAGFCLPPPNLAGHLTNDVSAFSANFITPRVHQASASIEREVANRVAIGVSYLFVGGQNLIRVRDVNLPRPALVDYPFYDPTGGDLLGYYRVNTFSSWQMTPSLTCPWPPCINPLQRPISQLGAINVFESAATSVYHGMTISVRRRMTSGLYFRLAYTWAHAIDDGQDALVVGQSSTVQNTYAASAERGSSVTDQRHRFAFSWIAEPRPFHRQGGLLDRIFNDWKFAGVATVGSGRPVDARIMGDPNQDDNSSNDRLPGYGRNAFTGPDYATTSVRFSRELHLGDRLRLVPLAEAFNVMNRANYRLDSSDAGFLNSAGQFVSIDKTIGISHFPGYYRRTTNFLRPTSAYAPRQIQFALRLVF